MKRPKRGGAKPLRRLPLPRGVVFHGRALDAYALTKIDAAVAGDLAALVRGDAETAYPWDLDESYRAALATDHQVRNQFSAWMKLVVLAVTAIERVEGFEPDEHGPVLPSFDLFAALLEEPAFEQAFSQISVLLMVWLDDEKNGFGAAQNGASAAAPNIARDAAPTTTPSSGTPAPEGLLLSTSTASAVAALTTSAPPKPNPAPSPGSLPPALEAGASDLAASPDSIGAP
jgi:hypothetical protein